MAVDCAFVRSLFAHLESGSGERFFEHVADDVDWTVEGTHPLAGRYRSKQDFHNCWVTRFAAGLIVEVRAYLDSALVQKLIDANPG